MKRLVSLILLLSCIGCVTIKIPKYLKSEFPYQKKYYASFDETLAATQEALKELGWRISDTTHPSVFEQTDVLGDKGNRQILIFIETRQTPLFLSSRYLSLNIYISSADDSTDLEIRSLVVTPVLFNSIQSYKNDAIVNKIFRRISRILEK